MTMVSGDAGRSTSLAEGSISRTAGKELVPEHGNCGCTHLCLLSEPGRTPMPPRSWQGVRCDHSSVDRALPAAGSLPRGYGLSDNVSARSETSFSLCESK